VAGKALPTEVNRNAPPAEASIASCSHRTRVRSRRPHDGKHLARRGFPWQKLLLDGSSGTSPVRAFPPNGLGRYDMTGNT